MKIIDLFYSNGYVVIEYITKLGAQRFDINKWYGEKTTRVLIEDSSGQFSYKDFDIDFSLENSVL